MGYEDFVSDLEAASSSGVSIATLHRFAEAGYLHIEVDNDGLKLFSRSELAQVFGGEGKGAEKPRLHASPSPTPADVVILEAPVSMDEAKEPIAQALSDEPKLDVLYPHEFNTSQSLISPPVDAAITDEPNRMAKILELQERLLELRESELRDLKEQRDWLKERVEKLEEQSDRDRVILLSEAQTIKQLITMEEPRRSPLRAALEYLGIAAPKPRVDLSRTGGSTYEVSSVEAKS